MQPQSGVNKYSWGFIYLLLSGWELSCFKRASTSFQITIMVHSNKTGRLPLEKSRSSRSQKWLRKMVRNGFVEQKHERKPPFMKFEEIKERFKVHVSVRLSPKDGNEGIATMYKQSRYAREYIDAEMKSRIFDGNPMNNVKVLFEDPGALCSETVPITDDTAHFTSTLMAEYMPKAMKTIPFCQGPDPEQ